MNKNNYASLEASQRLVDAGIVLETDAHWYRDRAGHDYLAPFPTVTPHNSIPAPSMAEAWRELPDEFQGGYLELGKHTTTKEHYAAYMIPTYHGDCEIERGVFSTNTNPTDALIDLLIYIKGVDTPK